MKEDEIINVMKAYSEGKTPIKKKWVCRYNKDTCDFCKELHGQTVKLGDTFKLKGYEFDSPPAHEGCNCYMVKIK